MKALPRCLQAEGKLTLVDLAGSERQQVGAFGGGLLSVMRIWCSGMYAKCGE